MNTDFEKIYSKREIGISHYPMPSSLNRDRSLKALDHLHNENVGKGLLLYLHIPFCTSICSFCPYNKVAYDTYRVKGYLDALSKEMDIYRKTKYIKNQTIEAIYFGGGTPSSLPRKQLIELLNQIKSKFRLSENIEITIEGNAQSFDQEKIKSLLESGVNRISIGIQSFNSDLCEVLEVPHTPNLAIETIKTIKSLGISNLSIDLMYNLPGQTMEMWHNDLETAVELGIDHISLFHLVVVPKTRLFSRVSNNELQVGDLTKELSMMAYAIDYFTSKGYIQGTTYDFHLPGKSHKYAVKHFEEKYDLLGLGLGAFGQLNDKVYINDGKLDDYLIAIEQGDVPIHLISDVTETDKIYQHLAMGLRHLEVSLEPLLEKGVDPSLFFENQITKLSNKGLIMMSDNKIALTSKGALWGNNICKEFFSEEYKKSLPAWQRMEELANVK